MQDKIVRQIAGLIIREEEWSGCQYVDGPIPTDHTCPVCGAALQEIGESLDSGDSWVRVWVGCEPCDLAWEDEENSYPCT